MHSWANIMLWTFTKEWLYIFRELNEYIWKEYLLHLACHFHLMGITNVNTHLAITESRFGVVFLQCWRELLRAFFRICCTRARVHCLSLLIMHGVLRQVMARFLFVPNQQFSLTLVPPSFEPISFACELSTRIRIVDDNYSYMLICMQANNYYLGI